MDSKNPDSGVANFHTQPLPAGLFPQSVATATSGEVASDARLDPAEDSLTTTMSRSRREAFIHGRLCAHKALATLGAPAEAIRIGSGGQALWPEGVVGSISHKAGRAAAAVAWRSQFASLGLDVEPVSALEADVVRLISRPEERENPAWNDLLPDDNTWSVLFSIKESIYKCLWPLLEHYIDFQDVQILIEAEDRVFAARSRSEYVPEELALSLRGSFQVSEGLITSAAWIRA